VKLDASAKKTMSTTLVPEWPAPSRVWHAFSRDTAAQLSSALFLLR
jgi:hypothetical protein